MNEAEAEDLAEVIHEFVEYCKGVDRADGFNVLMIETVLGTFANYLLGRAEAEQQPKQEREDGKE